MFISVRCVGLLSATERLSAALAAYVLQRLGYSCATGLACPCCSALGQGSHVLSVIHDASSRQLSAQAVQPECLHLGSAAGWEGFGTTA